MMILMDKNQPYSEALTVPCQLVLELVHSRLDEGLSSLPDDKGRLARKQVQTVLEFGSVENMAEEVSQLMKGETDLPEGATL